jgi:hypothetical protein
MGLSRHGALLLLQFLLELLELLNGDFLFLI